MEIVSIGGSVYLDKAYSTIHTVTETKTVLSANIGVYVLKDSTATTIQDLSDSTFVLSTSDDTDKAVDDINIAVSKTIKTTDFSSVDQAAKALYDGSVDAIIIKEAYADMLEDTKEIKPVVMYISDSDTRSDVNI